MTSGVRTVEVSGTERAQRAPLWLTVPASVGLALLAAPVAGLLVEAPWSDLVFELTRARVLRALALSITVASISAGFAVVLGVPIAYVLARTSTPFKRLIRVFAIAPLVLPPVVGGVALLAVFGRKGFIGAPLGALFGVRLPFTTAGAVLAGLFVSLPFVVVSVEGALEGVDARLERVARLLGASPGRVFLTITLPMIARSLGAGAVLAWARALGEFGATITFAGNVAGVTQTLPLAIYESLSESRSAAIAISLLLVSLSGGVLFAMRGRWVARMRLR